MTKLPLTQQILLFGDIIQSWPSFRYFLLAQYATAEEIWLIGWFILEHINSFEECWPLPTESLPGLP